jgi:hypothetical protein
VNGWLRLGCGRRFEAVRVRYDSDGFRDGQMRLRCHSTSREMRKRSPEDTSLHLSRAPPPRRTAALHELALAPRSFDLRGFGLFGGRRNGKVPAFVWFEAARSDRFERAVSNRPSLGALAGFGFGGLLAGVVDMRLARPGSFRKRRRTGAPHELAILCGPPGARDQRWQVSSACRRPRS